MLQYRGFSSRLDANSYIWQAKFVLWYLTKRKQKTICVSGSDCGFRLQGFQTTKRKNSRIFSKTKTMLFLWKCVCVLKINLKTISQLWTLVAQIELHRQNLCVKRKFTLTNACHLRLSPTCSMSLWSYLTWGFQYFLIFKLCFINLRWNRVTVSSLCNMLNYLKATVSAVAPVGKKGVETLIR